jgi:hypothetical protein
LGIRLDLTKGKTESWEPKDDQGRQDRWGNSELTRTGWSRKDQEVIVTYQYMGQQFSLYVGGPENDFL